MYIEIISVAALLALSLCVAYFVIRMWNRNPLAIYKFKQLCKEGTREDVERFLEPGFNQLNVLQEGGYYTKRTYSDDLIAGFKEACKGSKADIVKYFFSRPDFISAATSTAENILIVIRHCCVNSFDDEDHEEIVNTCIKHCQSEVIKLNKRDQKTYLNYVERSGYIGSVLYFLEALPISTPAECIMDVCKAVSNKDPVHLVRQLVENIEDLEGNIWSLRHAFSCACGSTFVDTVRFFLDEEKLSSAVSYVEPKDIAALWVKDKVLAIEVMKRLSDSMRMEDDVTLMNEKLNMFAQIVQMGLPHYDFGACAIGPGQKIEFLKACVVEHIVPEIARCAEHRIIFAIVYFTLSKPEGAWAMLEPIPASYFSERGQLNPFDSGNAEHCLLLMSRKFGDAPQIIQDKFRDVIYKRTDPIPAGLQPPGGEFFLESVTGVAQAY